jgi:hypothetical protein
MRLIIGFVLGLLTAATLVSAQSFIDQQSGTLYQEVPGGLLNTRTGELRLTVPFGKHHMQKSGASTNPC